MLADNVTDGLAETCFKSQLADTGGPNSGVDYPKVQICCLMVALPIKTQSSGDQLFHFYDRKPAKIY